MFEFAELIPKGVRTSLSCRVALPGLAPLDVPRRRQRKHMVVGLKLAPHVKLVK